MSEYTKDTVSMLEQQVLCVPNRIDAAISIGTRHSTSVRRERRYSLLCPCNVTGWCVRMCQCGVVGRVCKFGSGAFSVNRARGEEEPSRGERARAGSLGPGGGMEGKEGVVEFPVDNGEWNEKTRVFDLVTGTEKKGKREWDGQPQERRETWVLAQVRRYRILRGVLCKSCESQSVQRSSGD